ncbi:MAG TPA: hypothetical protein VK926_01545 [Gaiellaceae bacterium]|nr:hypothetical protein [Gaiellaceae bacterium]
MKVVSGSVRIEILARKDCPNRGMARIVVDRAVAKSGVPAEVSTVDVKTESQARKRRFLGSPSVRVGGIDVEPGSIGRTDFSLGDRIYRYGLGGLQGWPAESWIRSALLVASAQSASNGDGSSGRSSDTRP